jgi:aryl-alcohol dehydrogenase-like predicted oxidoreductase
MGSIDRREFLRIGTTGLVGIAAAGRASAADDAPRVRRRVKLGRTGLEIPDIGFGSSRLAGEENVVAHALARGITYFDTADGYTDGASETTLGRALRGRREAVVIATKTACSPTTTRAPLMRALENSLRRLQTDRVEIYFNHAVNDVARLRNEEWAAFAEQAKRDGKIRFTGISGHGGRLAECLDFALEHDVADVWLVAHNFGQDPGFLEQFTKSLDFVAVQPDVPTLLRKARAKGVGVIAMKTLRGARLNDMRPYEAGGATFAQAAFRWVLSGGLADALVVTMQTPESVDEYLGASGWTRTARADGALLARYEARNGASQCRYGCNACENACPAGAPIADLMRSRMYAEDYGDVSLARAALAEAGPRAGACLGCTDARCLGACPYGLPIAELALRAARLV